MQRMGVRRRSGHPPESLAPAINLAKRTKRVNQQEAAM